MERLPVDGNTSLKEQENTLRFAALAGPFRLLTYVKKDPAPGSSQKVNVASFETLSLDENVPEPILVEVTQSQSAASIIADQLASSKHVLCHERVCVGGVEKEVLGFS